MRVVVGGRRGPPIVSGCSRVSVGPSRCSPPIWSSENRGRFFGGRTVIGARWRFSIDSTGSSKVIGWLCIGSRMSRRLRRGSGFVNTTSASTPSWTRRAFGSCATVGCGRPSRSIRTSRRPASSKLGRDEARQTTCQRTTMQLVWLQTPGATPLPQEVDWAPARQPVTARRLEAVIAVSCSSTSYSRTDRSANAGFSTMALKPGVERDLVGGPLTVEQVDAAVHTASSVGEPQLGLESGPAVEGVGDADGVVLVLVLVDAFESEGDDADDHGGELLVAVGRVVHDRADAPGRKPWRRGAVSELLVVPCGILSA